MRHQEPGAARLGPQGCCVGRWAQSAWAQSAWVILALRREGPGSAQGQSLAMQGALVVPPGSEHCNAKQLVWELARRHVCQFGRDLARRPVCRFDRDVWLPACLLLNRMTRGLPCPLHYPTVHIDCLPPLSRAGAGQAWSATAASRGPSSCPTPPPRS